MSQSIGMISLGCAKNQVNAEQMLFLLRVAAMRFCRTRTGQTSSSSTPAASLRTRRQRQSTTSWRWAK